MTTKQRKALEYAAELIARKKADSICLALPGNFWIEYIEEAMMFDAGTDYWWGMCTMGEPYTSKNCRNARLLGIAFMLTMPKEMLQ